MHLAWFWLDLLVRITIYFKKNAEAEKEKENKTILGTSVVSAAFKSRIAEHITLHTSCWPSINSRPLRLVYTNCSAKVSCLHFTQCQNVPGTISGFMVGPAQLIVSYRVWAWVRFHYTTVGEGAPPTSFLTHFPPDCREPVNNSSHLLHADIRGSDYKSTSEFLTTYFLLHIPLDVTVKKKKKKSYNMLSNLVILADFQ